MKTKNKYSRWHRWLNKKTGRGAVSIFYSRDQHYTKITLEVADCSRSVQLDFSSVHDIKNSYHKLSVLRTALDRVEALLDEEDN